VELAGLNASFPFASRDADRLGYLSEDDNGDLWRLDLGGGATPLVVSTFVEYNPQHSPDGRRLAFSSNRTDERFEVWLGDADGSNVTRLTRGPGRAQGSPRWSPDGRTIAFDSQGADGHFDIWTIGVDGSGLRQVTRHPADENMPSWSRDGRFIYYGSNRTGRYEIWRVPPGGVTEEQVTHGGGFSPFESLDGRMLYYLREDPNTTSAGSGLVARPTAGGPERLIVECVDLGFGWGVGPRGVFHVDCRMPGVPDGALRVLRHWEAATGKDHEVTRVDCGLPPNLGLSASPDGRHLVFTRLESASNLMMIENFR
jgi:WD40 repeat protein